MKKTAVFIAIALAASISVSCVSTKPIAATSNSVGSKVGVSSTTVILGIFCFGNSGNTGVQKAAERGGIKKISTVDIKTEIFFPFIAVKRSCVVTGE